MRKRMVSKMPQKPKTEFNWGRLIGGAFVAAALTLSLITYHEAGQNEARIVEHAQQYEELEDRYESLVIQIEPKGNAQDELELRGFCVCVPSENSSDSLPKLCHSRNDVCDAESREICESQFTDRECG